MNTPAQLSTQSGIVSEEQILPGTIKPRHLAAATAMQQGDIYYVNSKGIFQRLVAVTGAALIIKNGVPTWQVGYTGTVVIPKLTTANGSLTVVNGIITAYTAPT